MEHAVDEQGLSGMTTPQGSALAQRVPARVSTGISGLDDILAGGLPPNRLFLVEGSPGTGKTTLALQFLLEGRRLGERTLYVTLSETEDELRASADSHGWSLDGISILELVPKSDLEPEEEQTLLHPAELELGETTGRILRQVAEERPSRLVIDSLSELRLLSQTALRYRRQVLALKHHFVGGGCTVLLLDDRTADPGDLQLRSIAHGVIVLETASSQYGAVRRSLCVAKVRGVRFRGGDHDYTLETGGITVYPRLVAAEQADTFSPRIVGSGIAEFDALLGGGLVPGTSTLLLGPAGAGKSTLATRCLLTALERGEPAAAFVFDEALGTFLARSAALGMDLGPHLTSGLLGIRRVEPAELSPGEFVHHVRQAVEAAGARVVMIDSLNGYLNAMPNERYLLLQMHELLSYLGHRGVVALLVLAQHGIVGEVRSDVDLSYMSDTVVLLRLFEAAGQVRRGLAVAKTRTSAHEPTIREFSLGRGGIRIGAVLHEFDGVLSGKATYRGEAGSLLGAMPEASSES